MIRRIVAVLAFLLVWGVATFFLSCGGLSYTDQSAVRQEYGIANMLYDREEAGTPGSAISRALVCISAGVARRNAVSLSDAGSNVVCDPP